MHTLQIKTEHRTQFVDITTQVQSVVTKSATKTGFCCLYVPHTTAAVTINEHADPDVASDVEAAFDRLVPHHGPYKLALGRWQGIFFCEFDGPRDRKLYVKVTSDRE